MARVQAEVASAGTRGAGPGHRGLEALLLRR